jgi:tetratricopeptide (TPR) repeat protein
MSEPIPDDPNTAFAHGTACAGQGRYAEAAAAFARALDRRPDWYEALTQLGIACGSAGRPADAVRAFRRAVAVRPDTAQAHHNLGVALIQVGRPDEGTAAIRHALGLQPDYPEAHYNLATALGTLGKKAEARDHFRHALALRPDYVEALNNLGLSLTEANRPDEAVPYLAHAVRLRPGFVEAHNNLGIALDALGRADQAEAAFKDALRLAPANPDTHVNLANTYKAAGRLPEALACYQLALWLRPDAPSARFNRALALLQAGDFAAGWAEYEWRLQRPPAQSRCPSDRPAWDGRDPAGRTVLLWAEQGLGDAVQFARYAPLVRARGARVVLFVPGLLAPVLRTLAGIDGIVVEGDPVPPHDLHCPLMSLPHRFGTTPDTVPAGVPYLAAPRDAAGRWAARLVSLSGFKVGVYWQGNPHHAWDRHRSVRLADLEPLARVPGVRLVSLQQGPGRDQLRPAEGTPPVFDLGPEYSSFDDLAGSVAAVDLVVCVDTAVAHLAGALGRPTWMLVSKMADWRWMQDRPDTPWYPTVRLFRQRRLGDWADVIDRVVERLKAIAGG